MATKIRTWQIVDRQLVPLTESMIDAGRTESYDLEEWITTNPEIIRPGLLIIGRQVQTRSGPLDLLAINRDGNLIIIELKRDQIPRLALAQAIDYASDIASWSVDRLSETCVKFTGKSLEEALIEAFPDIDLESLNINESQRMDSQSNQHSSE